MVATQIYFSPLVLGVLSRCESTKQEIQGSSPRNHFSMEVSPDRIGLTTYLAILKVVSGPFWDWVEKLKTSLYFQRIFDNPLAQYLISKELLEWIGYISTCLLKSELAQWTSASKKLYGPFLWIGLHCLKATGPLWGDSLLLTTKSPGVSVTHFIHLGRMKGWVNLGATEWFWTRDSWIGNSAR